MLIIITMLIKIIFTSSIIIIIVCYSFLGDSIIDKNTNISIVLGGYFGVHLPSEGSKECGRIDDESGIFLVEAMRYAIDQINSNSDILFGIKLGFRIFDTCSSVRRLRSDIQTMILEPQCAAVVGPATSDEAIIASVALGIFNMGVISYSATSIQLANREKYYNFYRTVPSDEIQAKVLVDILKHYNWSYISTVNSHGNYGQQGMEQFIKLVNNENICISTRNVLPHKPTKMDFRAVIRNLEKDPNARTVILFTSEQDTNGLLKATNANTRFTWLSSSAWTADIETVSDVKEAAKGAILLNYVGMNRMDFWNYFKNLKLNNNRYKWFEEFWNQTFNCGVKKCTGNESLSESRFYGKYAIAGAVIDAVNSFAYALRCTLSSCSNKEVCTKELAYSPFRYYTRRNIMKSSLCNDTFNNAIPYDKEGSYYRDIEIINFNGEGYDTVGIWKGNGNTSKLEMYENKIVWFNSSNLPPESLCSKPCKTGERMVRSKIKECCFTCHPCQGDEILLNNTCYKCNKYQTPDSNKATCVDLDKMEVKITNYLSLIALSESMIGFALNSFVLYLFIKHKDSKIVKSSSRELSFFMLAGLYFCFISPCIFLLHPTVVRCGLRRFIFGLSLTACYTPLMLKTNRIYRIFKAARVMVSMPYLVSPRSQILICFGLLALQLLLSIMWVVGDPPQVTRVIVHEYKMVAELCGADIFTIIINLVPCFCMLGTSTVFAFKSRKFPKNYNEAYNIGVTMYISCVLWAIFISAVLLVKTDTSNPFGTTFVIANFTNVIALVSLAGLFGPKVWRMLFKHNEEPDTKVTFSTGEKKCDLPKPGNSQYCNRSVNSSPVLKNEGCIDDIRKSNEEQLMVENECENENRKAKKSF